jgi:hypothetical protein
MTRVHSIARSTAVAGAALILVVGATFAHDAVIGGLPATDQPSAVEDHDIPNADFDQGVEADEDAVERPEIDDQFEDADEPEAAEPAEVEKPAAAKPAKTEKHVKVVKATKTAEADDEDENDQGEAEDNDDNEQAGDHESNDGEHDDGGDSHDGGDD